MAKYIRFNTEDKLDSYTKQELEEKANFIKGIRDGKHFKEKGTMYRILNFAAEYFENYAIIEKRKQPTLKNLEDVSKFIIFCDSNVTETVCRGYPPASYCNLADNLTIYLEEYTNMKGKVEKLFNNCKYVGISSKDMVDAKKRCIESVDKAFNNFDGLSGISKRIEELKSKFGHKSEDIIDCRLDISKYARFFHLKDEEKNNLKAYQEAIDKDLETLQLAREKGKIYRKALDEGVEFTDAQNKALTEQIANNAVTVPDFKKTIDSYKEAARSALIDRKRKCLENSGLDTNYEGYGDLANEVNDPKIGSKAFDQHISNAKNKIEKRKYLESLGLSVNDLYGTLPYCAVPKKSYLDDNVTHEKFVPIADEFFKNKKQGYYDEQFKISSKNWPEFLCNLINESIKPFIEDNKPIYSEFVEIVHSYIDKCKLYLNVLTLKYWYSEDQKEKIDEDIRKADKSVDSFSKSLNEYIKANRNKKVSIFEPYKNSFTEDQRNEINNDINNNSIGEEEFKQHVERIDEQNLDNRKQKQDHFDIIGKGCPFTPKQKTDINSRISNNEVDIKAFKEYVNGIVEENKKKEQNEKTQLELKVKEIKDILNKINGLEPSSSRTFSGPVEGVCDKIISDDNADESNINESINKLVIDGVQF